MRPGSLASNLYRAARRGTLFKTMVGREPFHWTAPDPQIVEFGSKYGRWAVRVDRLSHDTRLLCFGLGEDITFETALIARFGCRVVGFDPTPRSVAHLASLPHRPELSTHAVALADHVGWLEFQLPPQDAADQVSASAVAGYGDSPSSPANPANPSANQPLKVPCTTLQGALKMAGLAQADIVKMDVEGMEYRVLQQALGEGWLRGVSQLLVEFHHFLPGLHAQQTAQAIAALQADGFRIAWVGRTNHEYLFVRPSAQSLSHEPPMP